MIDGAIGELTIFHDTFGYFAHGVDDRTATLPDGWCERLVPGVPAEEAGLGPGVPASSVGEVELTTKPKLP